jgi:hypothetical protein
MIVVGCTTVAFKMTGNWHNWGAWLANAEQVMASVDDEVRYFAALEVDARGLEPFKPLIDRLEAIGGEYWTFSLNDKVDVITTQNRLRRICIGHNLVGEWAMENGASHTLFLASDTQCRDDVLPRLLEVEQPVVACHISTYNLGRTLEPLPEYVERGWDIRSHMETCACMLLRRDVFSRIKWHTNIDRNLTDDPAMHADVEELLHERVLSRHDVEATHWPQSIPAIEERHTDAERTVSR